MDLTLQTPLNHRHNPSRSGVFSISKVSLWVIMWVSGIWSCSDRAEITKEALYGKWEINRAIRNQQETPYLRGGYFVIDPSGMMTVNFTGVEEKSSFTLNNNILHLKDGKVFNIESMNRDSMSVMYQMNEETQFLIYLNKAKK